MHTWLLKHRSILVNSMFRKCYFPVVAMGVWFSMLLMEGNMHPISVNLYSA